jgi:SAM-dependent methyltransferase
MSEAWEAKAAEWAAWARMPGQDQFFLQLNWPAFRRLVPAPDGRTLDLGCGEGRAGRELAACGHRVSGIDSSPTLVALARSAGGYDEVVCGTAERMPYSDGVFGLAIAFMSLMDMDDPAAAIRETARVLAPGGRFCIAIIHPLNRPEPALADYFGEHRVAEQVERNGIPMVFEAIHRPLVAYASALAKAGFTIELLDEPRAQPDRATAELAAATRRPFFLHLRGRLLG